jgi:hypothetical protein
MKRLVHASLVISVSWLMPAVAFAIEAPPPPDAPFFGWLAVPIVAVAGQKLLQKKKSKDSDRL